MDKDLEKLRHSTAHLLASAVLSYYPKAKPTIGPAIENGFYYDFDFGDEVVSEKDLPKIEKKMHEILKGWDEMKMEDIEKKEAENLYKDNPYKKELIEEFSKDEKKLSVCVSGSFTDLCRGGHVDNPKDTIIYFKLLSVAGAYWRGSEKNKMLTRIYGTAFFDKKDLDEYLEFLAESEKRDHRKIGKEMELFTISEEVGKGLVLWLPNGHILKDELENFAKDTERSWGYQRVTTPEITKSNLYYTSGHLPYYKDDMYPSMKIDDNEEYFLKPMNCPHHHIIFSSKQRSYRDLPLRLAEYGRCYRYEASGELFGIMRVRGFAQNDAHIYCTEEQAVNEFLDVMKLHEHFYKVFGIEKYHLELSLRDPKNKKKYHGDDKMWEKAESLMRQAVSKIDIDMTEKIGGAAFYGPKIDFIIHSSIGREFAISTNQIDLFMGGKFNLKYTDNNGQEKTPVIIHRAPLGSHERFIGFLIEHYNGNFPLWLSPLQVMVLPISEKHLKYSNKITDKLKAEGIRAKIDDRNETLGSKIRDSQTLRPYYILVLGEKEESSETVSVRERSGKTNHAQSLDNFIKSVKLGIEKKSI